MLRLSVLLSLLAAATGYRICHEGLQCYPMGPPFSGTPERIFPLYPLPCPVTFRLLTRRNMEAPQEISSNGDCTTNPSFFDGEKKTYVVIHGYIKSSREPWVTRMCQTILEEECANCIMMDWSSCSWDVYIRVIQNLRVLGAQLNVLIVALQKKYGCPAETFHLIGDNVGSYIAGCAGRLNKRIGSITGLDPTAVLSAGEDRLHLAIGDACLVQIFHSDGTSTGHNGFGFMEPIGDIDVYLNGGYSMPECPIPNVTAEEALCLFSPIMGPVGCPVTGYPPPDLCMEILGNRTVTLDELRKLDYVVHCSHYQSLSYYMASVRNPERYRAAPCADLAACIKGKTQAGEEWMQVGHHARVPAGGRHGHHLYYLNISEPLLAY